LDNRLLCDDFLLFHLNNIFIGFIFLRQCENIKVAIYANIKTIKNFNKGLIIQFFNINEIVTIIGA
jgi:hypothetical protein